VISSALLPLKPKWKIVKFPSTLYLFPVLELLLQTVPSHYYADIHLGLQEALVNAAKHGNALDVQKSIEVKFRKKGRNYIWVIVDQGAGFAPPNSCHWPFQVLQELPEKSQECGRGIFILYQIFDEVLWSDNGRELQLSKTLA
jgi:serine/threonine-protein kinase RsbW